MNPRELHLQFPMWFIRGHGWNALSNRGTSLSAVMNHTFWRLFSMKDSGQSVQWPSPLGCWSYLLYRKITLAEALFYYWSLWTNSFFMKKIPPDEKALWLRLMIQGLFFLPYGFTFQFIPSTMVWPHFWIEIFNFPTTLAIGVSCISQGSQHHDIGAPVPIRSFHYMLPQNLTVCLQIKMIHTLCTPENIFYVPEFNLINICKYFLVFWKSHLT